VKGETFTRQPVVAPLPAVLGESFSKGTSVAGVHAALPFTGANVGLLVLTGLVLLGAGGAVTFAAARHRVRTQAG
jgi:hypothetical protein